VKAERPHFGQAAPLPGTSAGAAPTPAADGQHPGRWRALLGSRALLLLIALVVGGYAIHELLESIGGPEQVRARFGWFAPLVSVALHAPLAAAPFPSELLALSHAPLYGFWIGTAVGWAGWFLGSLIEYGVLRRLRVETVPTLSLRRPRWLARFPVEHPAFLIGVRQLPAGYHLVNVAAAMAEVPLGRFALCSAIAQIPNALLVAAVGLGIVAL